MEFSGTCLFRIDLSSIRFSYSRAVNKGNALVKGVKFIRVITVDARERQLFNSLKDQAPE